MFNNLTKLTNIFYIYEKKFNETGFVSLQKISSSLKNYFEINLLRKKKKHFIKNISKYEKFLELQRLIDDSVDF